MKMINLAILFSGNGSNLENLYKRLNDKIHNDKMIHFPIAISSKKNAYGIKRCENLGLKCEVLDYNEHKLGYDMKLMELLKGYKIDLVILAGFMRILGAEICANFKILNIHPSILPLFKGANAIRQSYESYMKIAGVSVHYVNEELDGGEIIAQDIIHKIKDESLESFEDRIHALEYEIYPKAILEVLDCTR